MVSIIILIIALISPYIFPVATIQFSPFMEQVFIAREKYHSNSVDIAFTKRLLAERTKPYSIIFEWMKRDDLSSNSVALSAIWKIFGINLNSLMNLQLDHVIVNDIKSYKIDDLIYSKILNNINSNGPLHRQETATLIMLHDGRMYEYVINRIKANDQDAIYFCTCLDRYYPLTLEQRSYIKTIINNYFISKNIH
jgi:hypothetical protein